MASVGFAYLLALAALIASVKAYSTCVCPLNYQPVCGSDGTTYGNLCSYTCAAVQNPHLTLRNEGPCKATPAPSNICPCTRELRVICGTNGQTYRNPCLLRCAAKTDPKIKEAYSGPCKEEQQKNTCACTRNYQPVCGSDGVTYGNECTFRCAQNTNPGLTLAYVGECGESRARRSADLCPCTKELRPVCGSNRRTYSNPCLLKCAARRNPGLRVAHTGSCH